MNDIENKETILDHNYDGIQEYDNPMPKWWINIFIGTSVFAALYVFHYELGNGRGIHQAYADEVALFEAEEAVRLAEAGAATEESLVQLTSVTENLSAGQKVYIANCQACHGPSGGGLIGPNLTDNYWLHGGGTMMGIYGTVAEGILDKGMPAWNRVLTPQDLENVVAFVGTMRGKNVEGGKEPQGEPRK